MIQKRCLTVLTCFHLHRSVALNSIDKTIFDWLKCVYAQELD